MKNLISRLSSWFVSCLALPDRQFRLFVACFGSLFLITATALNSGILPTLVILSVLVWQAPKLRLKAEKLPRLQTAMNLFILLIAMVLIIVLPPGMLWPIPVAVNRGAFLAFMAFTRLTSSKPDKKMVELERQMKEDRAKKEKAAKIKVQKDLSNLSKTQLKRRARQLVKKKKK